MRKAHYIFWTASIAVLLLAPLEGAQHAYLPLCCNVPSAVSIIDRATHSVTATPLAGVGASYVALTPDGTTAYVTNETDQTITILDTASGSQKGVISLAPYQASPYGAVVSPDGTRLYVTAVEIPGAAYLIGIDTRNNSILFDTAVPGAWNNGLPCRMPPPLISPDGRTVYFAGYDLALFDTATETVIANIPFGESYSTLGFTITQDGAYAMVTYNRYISGLGEFVLIDLQQQKVVKQIAYGQGEFIGPVVTSPDGTTAYYISNQTSGESMDIEVFDVASRRVTKTLSAGTGGGVALAITPDGSELEIGNEANAMVVSLNVASGAVTARTGTPGQLVTITVSQDGTRIYVPDYGSSVVGIIDPRTGQVTGEIPAGWIYSVFDSNSTLAMSASGKRAVVLGTTNLSVIDVVEKKLAGVQPLYGKPLSVSLSPDGDRAYVTIGNNHGTAPELVAVATTPTKLAGMLTLTAADEPSGSAVSADGSTLYLSEQYCPTADSCEPRLLEIDTTSLTVTGQISLGTTVFNPGQVVLSSSGSTAYVSEVSDSNSSGVGVVNLTKRTLTENIGVQYGYTWIALAPNQRYLYQAAESDYFLYFVDLAKQQVTPVPDSVNLYWEYPSGVAVSLDGKLLYLASETESYIAVFSIGPSGLPEYTGTINLPSGTRGVVFSPF